MNTLIFKGSWNDVKGRLKKAYGDLTDDDLVYIEGEDDQLLGRLQKRLGQTKDQIRKIISEI